MKSRIAWIATAVASLSLICGSAGAMSPPIDCAHAKTVVEQEICQSPVDVALDRQIAALYDLGLAELQPDERHALVESQRHYLHLRAGCDWAMHSAHPGAALSECVHSRMEERLHALRHIVDKINQGQ